MAGINGLKPGALITLGFLLLGCGAEGTNSTSTALLQTTPANGAVDNADTGGVTTPDGSATPDTQPDTQAPVDLSNSTNTGDTVITTTDTPVTPLQPDTTDPQTPLDTANTDTPATATPDTPSTPPPTDTSTSTPQPATENQQAEETQVAKALRTGDAQVVEDPNDLISATIEQIETDRTRFDSHLHQLFALQGDGSPDSNSLTGISWDPTHDAAMLVPSYGINATALHTNSVTTETNTVYEKSIAIIGDSPARYMAVGSNPMRNSYRNSESVNDQMHQFMLNSISWLTASPEADALNIVIAHMADSYYFPDETGTRRWLDDNYGSAITYNNADQCDDDNLNQCLTADTDLLIISQVLNENSVAGNIAATVSNAMLNGTPVLYLHHDGGITELGRALLAQMHISYEWDNYWKKLQLTDYNIADHIGTKPQSVTAINIMLNHLLARNYEFDWSYCDGENCSEVLGLYAEFEEGAAAVKSVMNALDTQNRNVFTRDDHTVTKLLALTGDRLRQDVSFPMDKNATDDNLFMRSYFADHAAYYSRAVNPPLPDMGNFSRSSFSHITPVNKTVTVSSKQPFRSTGVYALPGETIVVTRIDNSDVDVELFINTQRTGSTHQWADDGYSRPKYLKSPEVPIESGKTIALTSPYGGTVQLSFNDNDLPVTLQFQNIGEHPYWRSTEDDIEFAQQLNDGHYDWAEMVTPGFEVHSTLVNMRDSVNNNKWGSAAALATATVEYLHNYPHVLAGFQGPGINTVDEIHNFATTKGFTIDTIDKVKHMNADQATCGYGCSGNPYDAYWS